MLPDYQNMNLSTLIDLLVEKTQALSQMRTDNEVGIIYEHLKEEVRQLQAVIQSRKVVSIYRTRTGRGPAEAG